MYANLEVIVAPDFGDKFTLEAYNVLVTGHTVIVQLDAPTDDDNGRDHFIPDGHRVFDARVCSISVAASF